MTRRTEGQPKRAAIQPKIGDQIGIPEKRQTKNVTATTQWIRREERLWRTISLPTTTSSRFWATITAGSAGRRVAAARVMGPPFILSGRSFGREVGVFGGGPG